ncbi:MAG: hypothetical protein KF819_38640 [Labilithrix sp.]|nr:hypothetical protein [Labilithrix sp.]
MGVEAVLGAMVAARRRTLAPAPRDADGSEELEIDDSDADETTPRGRPPVQSEVFLKAR